jgi:hypothetical protein
MDAEHGRRDSRLELRRQLRLESERIERRISDRYRAERVEPCRQVAVHPMGFDKSHGGSDASEELDVDDRRGRGLGDRFDREFGERRPGVSLGLSRFDRCGDAVSVPDVMTICRVPLEQSREPREDVEDSGIAVFEQCAPLGGNSLGIVEIFVQKQTRVSGIYAVDVMHCNHVFCTSGELPPAERSPRHLRRVGRRS